MLRRGKKDGPLVEKEEESESEVERQKSKKWTPGSLGRPFLFVLGLLGGWENVESLICVFAMGAGHAMIGAFRTLPATKELTKRLSLHQTISGALALQLRG